MKKISTSQIYLTTRQHFPSLWPDNWNMDSKNKTGSTLHASKAAGQPRLCFNFPPPPPTTDLSSSLITPKLQLKHRS